MINTRLKDDFLSLSKKYKINIKSVQDIADRKRSTYQLVATSGADVYIISRVEKHTTIKILRFGNEVFSHKCLVGRENIMNAMALAFRSQKRCYRLN